MDHSKHHAYLVFMLFLSLFALGIMALELTNRIGPESRAVVEYVDNFVCFLFFVDYIHQIVQTKNKLRYLLTWGLLDLVSCLPMVNALRWARTARIVRIVRVLRCARSARILVKLVVEKRVQSAALAGTLVVTILVTTASISVLHFEAEAAHARITTAADAIWWAIYTMLTIGYDKTPVTTEGCALGAILGFLGMGIFGSFSGFVAYWFLGSGDAETTARLEELQGEFASIKKMLEGHFRERQAIDAGSNSGGEVAGDGGQL